MNGEKFRAGHRSRVKQRFLREGLDFFLPHEVAELLLFYAIPQKDTKLLAHALIDRFGSLSAALEAEPEQLCAVPGIGKYSADFLHGLPAFARYVLAEPRPASYGDADALGSFFVSLFQREPETKVAVTFFNNRCELLQVLPLSCAGLCAPSFSVRDILEAAYASNASYLAIGYQKEGAVAFPSSEELSISRELMRVFENAGVHMMEILVIAAQQYNPLLRYVKGSLHIAPLSGFGSCVPPQQETDEKTATADSVAHLASILSYVMPPVQAKELAKQLLERFGTITNLLFFSWEQIIASGLLTEHAATLLRLSAALYSYMNMEKAKTSGKIYASAAALGELFCGVHAFLSVERVSMVLLDAQYRLIDIRFLAQGSVNAAAFVPRLFVEAAVKSGAKYVAIAHNHPSGETFPSAADHHSTEEISRAFNHTGVVFLEHFVVNEHTFYPICYQHLPLCTGGDTTFFASLNKTNGERHDT